MGNCIEKLHSERGSLRAKSSICMAWLTLGILAFVASPSNLFAQGSTPGSQTRAINLSTRLVVGTGNDVAIAGFIIGGSWPAVDLELLIRGIGPSLSSGGVPNPLGDPVLSINGKFANDNWRDIQEPFIIQTGLAPPDDLESALLAHFSFGNFTAILSGNDNGGTGVGLVEIYNLEPGSTFKLLNISTRGLVGTGGDIVIVGFILGGGSNDEIVLIRGLGPTLMFSDITNFLENPTLELRNSDGIAVASNDDWETAPPVSLPPTYSMESSAIELPLSPGAYTALLSGVGNAAGIGLVEIYDLGPSVH